MPDTTAATIDGYLLISSNAGVTEYEVYPTLLRAVEIAADMSLGEYGERCFYFGCWSADRFGCPIAAVPGFDAMVKEACEDAEGDTPERPAMPVVL